MSYSDFLVSRQIAANPRHTFERIIMAAMRTAKNNGDDSSFITLAQNWPEIGNELEARLNKPGGRLGDEKPTANLGSKIREKKAEASKRKVGRPPKKQ